MATYTADQLIGKTLVANRDIIAHYGNPTGKTTFKIYKGQNAGVVNSYIIKTTPDHKLWWQFKDSRGLLYYTPNENLSLTDYDKGTMKTIQDKIREQKEKEQAEKNKGVGPTIERIVKKALWIGAGAYVFVQGVKIFVNDRSKSKS